MQLKLIKTWILVVMIITGRMGVLAQKTVYVDSSDIQATNYFFSVNGEPFVNFKFKRLTEGSPYFLDAWIPGSVLLTNGSHFKNISLRLNLVDHQVHFLAKDGKEYISDRSLKEVRLPDPATGKDIIFRTGYKGIGKISETTFFMVLEEGNLKGSATLLKHIERSSGKKLNMVQQPARKLL